MPTLSELIEKYRITAKVRHLGLRDTNEYSAQAWQHDRWEVKLFCDGRTMTTEYSTGIGHRKLVRAANPSDEQRRLAYQVARNRGIKDPYGYATQPVEPETTDVLSSLISDAQSVESEPLFEDWASSCGYDTDSRRAERIYFACQEMAKRLRTLLGSAYREFLEADLDD